MTAWQWETIKDERGVSVQIANINGKATYRIVKEPRSTKLPRWRVEYRANILWLPLLRSSRMSARTWLSPAAAMRAAERHAESNSERQKGTEDGR